MPEPDVTARLGRAKPAWDAVVRWLDAQPGATRAWKLYAGEHGWQLKVSANRKALAYLIPRAGYFTVAVALREPMIAELRERGFPADRLREIAGARAAPEGQPARVEVRSLRDVELVTSLVAVKLGARRR